MKCPFSKCPMLLPAFMLWMNWGMCGKEITGSPNHRHRPLDTSKYFPISSKFINDICTTVESSWPHFYFLFWRQGLCSPDWPGIHRNQLASSSLMLRLKRCTSCLVPRFSIISKSLFCFLTESQYVSLAGLKFREMFVSASIVLSLKVYKKHKQNSLLLGLVGGGVGLLRQEDYKFKASPTNLRRPCLKMKQKNEGWG